MTALAHSSAPIECRPYQDDAIRKVRREMARVERGGRGHNRVCLVLPTGAGKTRTAAKLVQSAITKGTRVLWLAHRTELVDQACKTLHGFGLPVGVVAACSKWRVDSEAPVQVASIQTLLAREAERPKAGLIVWDEAHHASEAAERWSSLLDAYQDVPLVGLTATPERGDGAGLAPLFNGLVVGATVRELTAMGHLVPCEVIRPERQLEPGRIAQSPVDAYREHGGRRQAIVFARTVEEAERYAAEYNAGGVRAECVTATTPPADREAALELFRRGVVRVLTNVYVLTEGTDLPSAEVCILARGASSAGIYLQMVGRVLRPAPGKTSCLLIDLRGVSHVHLMPEDERLYSLEGKGIMVAATQRCASCTQVLEGGYPCALCGYCPTAGEAAETVIVNAPLHKFSRMIAQGPEQRRQTLLRWVAGALEKGHKVTAVRHKWRAVYNEELSAEQLMSAQNECVRNRPSLLPGRA